MVIIPDSGKAFPPTSARLAVNIARSARCWETLPALPPVPEYNLLAPVIIYSQDSGKVVGIYQRDLLIENKIIMEIKCRFATKIDEKQLYHYLRNSEYELGLLVNFSTPSLFIKRIIYTNDRKPYLNFRVT